MLPTQTQLETWKALYRAIPEHEEWFADRSVVAFRNSNLDPYEHWTGKSYRAELNK